MLIAIGHIVGAFFVTVLIMLGIAMFSDWDQDRRERLRNEELASRLGVSVGRVYTDEIRPKLIEILSQRYSSDLFSNRLSDIASVLILACAGFGLLLTIGIGLFVLWRTVFENRGEAGLIWTVPALIFFFSLAFFIVEYVCRLLTGRYPGEAKCERKNVLKYLNRQTEKNTLKSQGNCQRD